MSQAHRRRRGLHPTRTAAAVFGMSGSTLIRVDPDGLRHVATLPVRAHWFVVAFSLVQPAYRPSGWPERHAGCAPLFLLQRLGAGRREVAAAVRPAVRCHPIGFRRPLTSGGLVWVLE